MRDAEKLEVLVEEILIELGIDMTQGDVISTPRRVAKMLIELTRGYSEPRPELWTAPWYGPPILMQVEPMAFYSLCEHHWLVFFGSVYVSYIPDKLILGLSKPARFVDWLSHRFMIQERFTKELCDELFDAFKPLAIQIRVEAEHTCSAMRGIKSREQAVKTKIRRFKNVMAKELWFELGGDKT